MIAISAVTSQEGSKETIMRNHPPLPSSNGETAVTTEVSTPQAADIPELPRPAAVEVVLPLQAINSSAFTGVSPAIPQTAEKDALSFLLCRDLPNDSYNGSDFTSFILDDFTVYLDQATTERYGMVSLDKVGERQGEPIFFFDGTVRSESSGCEKAGGFYLQRISFTHLSVGGYEDLESHRVGSDIWIQSTHGRERKVWYQLGKPAAEYKPYHRLFLWVANLAKYLVDYLSVRDDVRLSDFESLFLEWLSELHSSDAEFNEWLKEFNSSDFRQAIVRHGQFLYNQAVNLGYESASLWDEIGLSPTPAIPRQDLVVSKTVVTPYAYQCFKKMEWSEHLTIVDLDSTMAAEHNRLLHWMGFRPKKKQITLDSQALITPGNVIAVKRDDYSAWKGDNDLWYALVQGISDGHLDLIWLYKPTDTICANLTYPCSNELFLSDHCNCRESKIKITEVVKKVSVCFYSYSKSASFFVRQTYHSADETFTTLKNSDFRCQCKSETSTQFALGETVLYKKSGLLEPAEILEFQGPDVKIRLFPRRFRDFSGAQARPNELVYSDRIAIIKCSRIERACHIRFYPEHSEIPAPYNRDGNGDAFYITYAEDADGSLFPATPPEDFHHGFDPIQNPVKKILRALNLFSGGGNFDRGLEEGMAIKNEWAVEWALAQMLTYRANHKDPENAKLFCGSVNDYLAMAMRGQGDDLIARLGEVEFISAGSPCQGYSLVNALKTNAISLRNCSMIASVVAFIDFYRPQYAILENVPAMASKSLKRSPLSQLICAFVGMGYQLRLMNLDAWSFGAPQSRSRLFILIAAPGLKLPEHPPLTHSHPAGTTLRALGEAPNGLPFGERRWNTPVFKYVSASEGTKDLPCVHRGKITSIPFPDHRPARIESPQNQVIVDHIPKFPRKMGLHEAMAKGYLNFDPYPHHSQKRRALKTRAWSRVDPDFLIPTITTGLSPSCKFTGRWLHWDENRLITIMEARRAQGFPDSEVLIGGPLCQWKIVGNSVARQVALAVGLSIRDAWLRNPPMIPFPGLDKDKPAKKRKFEGLVEENERRIPSVQVVVKTLPILSAQLPENYENGKVM